MILLASLFLLAQAPDPDALSERATGLARQNRPQEAEKLWLAALKIAPGHFAASLNLGFLYHSRGDYAEAEPMLARAVRSQPNDFNARYLYGAALQALGRSDDALRQWRQAISIRPDHAKLLQIMAVEYGKGRYFRESAAAAARALELQPDDSSLYLVAIKAHQDAADHPAALRIAEAMVKRFPSMARAQFEYGYELHRAARPDEALPHLKKAMELDPSYEEPFFFYGEIMVKEGRWEEAIPALRRTIAIRRDYIAAWVMLARALIGHGRLELAKTELLKAIEADPKHPQPHLLLSQLYFRLGEETLAAKEKDLSLKLRRENPEALESRQGRPFPAAVKP